MKAGYIKKLNDGHGPNMSSDSDNDNRLRNIEEKLSISSDEYENNKSSVGNRREPGTRCQKKEAGPTSDSDNMHEEETSLQTHHTDGSDESDVVEHDVKVCDICGDAGREDLLAICCRCPDGAEHTYCMKVMVDKVPEGDWICEECKSEEIKNTNRQKNSTEIFSEKDQSSDSAVMKVSGKRRAEELESSPSKRPALEITKSTKDVDRGKVKPSYHISSDSHFGSEPTEGPRSPPTRPRLQSLKGAFGKSSSFSFSNTKSKTKLVDEIALQRQKSTKECSSHDTIAAKEMSKSTSFRSANLGCFGPSGSKVKMLSPNSLHVQDLKYLINKKERGFERTSSVKLTSTSSSASALTPKVDKLSSSSSSSPGETNSVSNFEAKPLKMDNKVTSGLKSNNRLVNTGAEASVSQGQIDKQLPSSPTKVVTASSGGANNPVEHTPIDNSLKVTPKEPANLSDGIKESTTGLNPGPSAFPSQNIKQSAHSAQGSLGNNASSMKNSKDEKNRDNKLKDAIEAALLKKPGIYRKTKVSDQPDESSVPTMNNGAAGVDRVPHLRTAGSLTNAEVSSSDWHGQISRTSSVDNIKQSNGSSYKPSMILPADDVALSFLSKNQVMPDNECIWQGGFEINRSGKTAEFCDGLQAHLSTCASPRVFEAVNNLPHKIILNGVSRISAWPSQFENSGVKENNIAIYFFAKDLESYEKSYLVLLDDMIKSDLALIGSINGVELLIFPSNQLPERSNRWNMLFFLWGVLRGKKKKSSRQISKKPEKSCAFQPVVSADKVSLVENASLIEKDKQDELESKVNSKMQNDSMINSKLQNPSHEKATDSVNVVRASSKDIISENNLQNEPKKRPFIDLSEDVDFEGPTQTNTWRDVSGHMVEDSGNVSKKQKSDLYGQNSNLETQKTDAGNSNGERYFFPVERGKIEPKPVFALDLNEDITCLVGENDNIMMTKKDDDDVASLSLSLSFSPPDKDAEDNRGMGKWQSGSSMLRFRDTVDK